MSTLKKISLKKIILYFIVYTFLFVTLFSFLDYYAYYSINPWMLSILSLILGMILTYIHVKRGNKLRIDDMVDKL